MFEVSFCPARQIPPIQVVDFARLVLLLLALKIVRGLIPKAIDESKQLGLPKVFDKLRMGGGKDNQHVAFAPEHVQAKFLAEGMFDELNAGSAARHLADHRDWPAAFRGLQSVPRDHQA